MKTFLGEKHLNCKIIQKKKKKKKKKKSIIEFH